VSRSRTGKRQRGGDQPLRRIRHPRLRNVGLFQYTGQIWLPELGVYSYKARMYDPKLGRFLQMDPIGYGDGMNMYAYVGADPVNSRDPSGERVLTLAKNRNCGKRS
jgi:RHS repeat-associated protein